MKKFAVLLLAVFMLFAFAACENNPNEESSDVPMATLSAMFKAVIGDIDTAVIAHTEGDVTVDGYAVSYTYDPTGSSGVISTWTVEINATKEGADTIHFVISSADLGDEIEVTIGEEKYNVAANDIKADTIINGFVGDDDEEEQTPVQDN